MPLTSRSPLQREEPDCRTRFRHRWWSVEDRRPRDTPGPNHSPGGQAQRQRFTSASVGSDSRRDLHSAATTCSGLWNFIDRHWGIPRAVSQELSRSFLEVTPVNLQTGISPRRVSHGRPSPRRPLRSKDDRRVRLRQRRGDPVPGHATLASWRTEILAHDHTGASNGSAKGLNLCVNGAKRCSHGFKRFEAHSAAGPPAHRRRELGHRDRHVSEPVLPNQRIGPLKTRTGLLCLRMQRLQGR